MSNRTRLVHWAVVTLALVGVLLLAQEVSRAQVSGTGPPKAKSTEGAGVTARGSVAPVVTPGPDPVVGRPPPTPPGPPRGTQQFL